MNNHTDPQNEEEVAGERRIPNVTKGQSLQSKMNNFLGIAIIALLGGGFLFWYYSNVVSKQQQIQEAKRKQQEQQMQGDTNLPKLGAVPFPSTPSQPSQKPSEPVNVGDIFGPPPILPDTTTTINNTGNNNAAPPPKTPEQLAEERRLNSPVFAKSGTNATATATPQNPGLATGSDTPTGGNTALGDALKPTKTVAARAQKLPTMTYLIPKGAKGDCTLETAIDSQLPGLVTCVLAFDIYGANGKAVMLERGTTLTGETRSQVQQGQNRLFVLWAEARTPTGVTAQLDSPATDALGRSGVTGEVDTHFWDRFGAAILISVVNGATQAGASYASGAGTNGGTSINYNPQGANSVMTEVLRNTINIPPTIRVAQGERVQILFARDVDFRPVYALSDRYPVIQ
jgi:type IV secretion system protein VirB10